MSKSNMISSFLPNDLLCDLQIKEEDLNQIEEYTEKRYINGHANCGWKTFHKEAGYVGLWSHEAGAVSKLLDLDDTKLVNSIHYPYDMVHFTTN